MAPTPRQLARERTMSEIVRLGRAQLGTVGPADLSLRAVARELGLVSSAIYRYVRNRDEFLTLLIVDAFDELGDAIDRAVADVAHEQPRRQIHAVGEAALTWARTEPSRWALLYGTPVPGYHAPAETTTEPGTRMAVAIARVLDTAYTDGVLDPPRERLTRAVRADLERVRRDLSLTIPAEGVARGLALWSGMVGLVSFDVFDQYGGDTLTDRSAFFRHQVDLLADLAGVPRVGTPAR